MKTCKKCKKLVANKSKLCRFCGADVTKCPIIIKDTQRAPQKAISKNTKNEDKKPKENIKKVVKPTKINKTKNTKLKPISKSSKKNKTKRNKSKLSIIINSIKEKLVVIKKPFINLIAFLSKHLKLINNFIVNNSKKITTFLKETYLIIKKNVILVSNKIYIVLKKVFNVIKIILSFIKKIIIIASTHIWRFLKKAGNVTKKSSTFIFIKISFIMKKTGFFIKKISIIIAKKVWWISKKIANIIKKVSVVLAKKVSKVSVIIAKKVAKISVIVSKSISKGTVFITKRIWYLIKRVGIFIRRIFVKLFSRIKTITIYFWAGIVFLLKQIFKYPLKGLKIIGKKIANLFVMTFSKIKLKPVLITAIVLCVFGGAFCAFSLQYQKNSIVDNTKIITPEKATNGKIFFMGDIITYKGVNYQVTKVETSEGNYYKSPKPGNIFLIVYILITNNTNNKIPYSYNNWMMSNSKNIEEKWIFTAVNSGTALYTGQLEEGGTKTGSIVFEQPKNDKKLLLNYYNLTTDSHGIETINKNKKEFSISIKIPEETSEDVVNKTKPIKINNKTS